MISIHDVGARRAVLLFAAVALLPGCVTKAVYSPPTDALLPSVRAIEAESLTGKPFTGLRLESRVAGSLMELDFSPGLEVTAVTAGSPAESAGLRVGDRIVKANGKVLETPDQFDAIVETVENGNLELDVERDGGVATVEIEPRRRESTGEWRPTRYAERLKARFTARTITTTKGELACEITEIDPSSPLAAESIMVGARIVELDGERVTDARLLMQELGSRPFGSSVTLGIEGKGGLEEFELELFDPPHRITGLGLPILFRWQRDPGKDETRFTIVDLWLFAVYSWTRKVETRRHELLGFTLYETGVGEIAEMPLEDTAESREQEESR